QPFSHRNNRFWAVLHLAGFTDVRLHPENERRLLEYGCGITAIIHRPTRRAEEIAPEEFRKARSGFEAKMRHYAPRSIAFLGKYDGRNAAAIFKKSPLVFGWRQEVGEAGEMENSPEAIVAV